MDDLISVIVPIFNAAAYIERCVKSIQNQTYTNFELILVNDGSTDNTLEICKMLADKDKRLAVLDRPNGGALFDPHSIDECADAINRVLSLNMVELGNYNREKIKGFELSEVNRRMKNIYGV